MKLCQVIALLLLMQGEMVLADSSATSDTEGRIAVGRYVAGGVVGTTLGLGIGHAMQGRYWRDYGWAFTAGEIITLFGTIFSISFFQNPSCDDACQAREERETRNWFTSFLLVKAAETVAVWWPRNVNFETSAKTQAAKGWKHTAWQAGASGPDELPEPGKPPKDMPTYPACDEYELMSLVGVPLWAALKIVEIASVWGPSPDHYRIATTKNQSPSLAIVPLLNTKQVGVQLVLRI